MILDQKLRPFQDKMEKHGISDYRDFYSETQKYTFWIKKINNVFFVFKLRHQFRNTHEQLPFVRIKESKAACLLRHKMSLEQLAWNCAGRYRRATQVVPFVSCAQLRFPFNLLYNGLLKSQCESVHLLFGCLLQIRSDCLGSQECYCAGSSHSRSPAV